MPLEPRSRELSGFAIDMNDSESNTLGCGEHGDGSDLPREIAALPSWTSSDRVRPKAPSHLASPSDICWPSRSSKARRSKPGSRPASPSDLPETDSE
jgi:hypothetical protein